MKKTITVQTHLDEKVFRRFCNFDTFRIKKRFVNPLMFFAGMGIFSVISFCQTDKEQSVLLGAVLGGIAILFPLVYILLYESSVSREAKKFGLKKKPLVYSLDFHREEPGVVIHGTHGEPEVTLGWDKIHRVFRRQDCFYLYATAAKAFLLPVEDLPVSAEEFRDFLRDNLGDRLTDLK